MLLKEADVNLQIWACIMFMALELDRANINQANTDNFLGDLKMTTNGKFIALLCQNSTNLNRLQPWKHSLQAIFPLRRIT